jgi:hypothetical protein
MVRIHPDVTAAQLAVAMAAAHLQAIPDHHGNALIVCRPPPTGDIGASQAMPSRCSAGVHGSGVTT